MTNPYAPDSAFEILEKERAGITLADELQLRIALALKEFIADDTLAYFAMADDLLPATLAAFSGLDLNDYIKES